MSGKPYTSIFATFVLLLAFLPAKAFQSTHPAPTVRIDRDDHVATIEMDFDAHAGHGGQLWTIGTDGLDPAGYLVRWWPDPAEVSNIDFSLGCANENSAGTTIIGTSENPYQVVTPNPIVQIQPLANNVTYHLKVEKVNGLGQVVSPATEMTFQGGDGSRVAELRSSMTFFDDFNWEEGPADELKWNNAMGPQTDPRFNLFFINKQCHVHTLNGTRNDGAGDRSLVAQRARKKLLIEQNVERRIVFDMDGIFSGRSVWYLDLTPVPTDLMSHLSFFDTDGDTGLPADMFRLRAVGNEISVSLINSAGASQRIADTHLPSFGRRMHPNVRRTFDVRLSATGVQIRVDDTTVLEANFPAGAFKPGVYYPLWSTVGYNTSKDDNPYFLSHWDNFGFDGPDLDTMQAYNYVTRIAGTDLQKSYSWGENYPIYNIEVPDDFTPTQPDEIYEAWLVFSYQKNDFSTFTIEPGDYFTFNGVSFPLPEGGNNSDPLVPGLVNYAGSPLSNRVKIGEISSTSSILNVGNNTAQFFATNTGIMNVHLEIMVPDNISISDYTQPADIHPFVYHGDLPKLGAPAKITFIDSEELQSVDDYLTGPTVSDTMQVEVLVGNTSWANWAPQWLNQPANSAEFWSTGSTAGIAKVDLFMRPLGETDGPGDIVASIHTNEDSPAPQLRYVFNVDTRSFTNGEYELFLQATDSKGYKSHPSYHGFAFRWDAEEISGAYYPVRVTIENSNAFIFNGSNGPQWQIDASWAGGQKPPSDCDGSIIIDADCEVSADQAFEIPLNCLFFVNPGHVFEVLR